MKSRIFFKLLAAFLVVIAVATVTLDFSIRKAWEDSLRSEIERSLVQKTRALAQRVENNRTQSLQEVALQEAQATEARVTIIERSGRVLADSEADVSTMENHAARPEVAAALKGSMGSATRVSHTVGIEFLYVAAPTRDGVVRLAYPLSGIRTITGQVRATLLKSSLLALLIAAVLAGIAAHSISRRLRAIVRFAGRIAGGDLTARIAEHSTDEIAQVAAALDVTARKFQESFIALENSRSELETLLNSMQDAVIAVDAAARVQWANGAMRRILGDAVRIGANLVETVRDPALLTAIQDSLTHREERRTKLNLLPVRAFEATTAPMPGGGAVAVLHDISEIERVEKTRRDFIANVSHELKTPLTSIQGYTETLLDTAGADAGTREFLDIIRRNSALMSRLTDDLLTLARVESGEDKLEVDPVSARDLLEDALRELQEIARSSGMELKLEAGSNRAVLADRDAIHQVFANLVNNATRYARSGGRIVVGSSDIENGVEFFVRDFGPGIASEHLPRLFERFYRADKARSRESGGTGLGLAIVKHIIINHGGSVRAESELGHGSTFAFTLPLAAVAAAQPAR